MADDLPVLDLARFETAGLLARILPEHPTTAFGVYALAGDDPVAEVVRKLERQVFEETFGDSPELLELEYGPYDDSSLFLLAVDHRRMVPAGAVRIILPSETGWKSLVDVERIWGIDVGDVIARTPGALTNRSIWDIATLAVAPDYRGAATSGLVSMALYQGLFMTAPRCGAQYFVAMLDSVVLRFLQWQLHHLFSRFEGLPAAPYLGSKSSSLVWFEVEEWRRRLEVTDPTLHELLFEGIGLEAAVSTPDWDEVAALAVERSERDVYASATAEAVANR
jgi:hypothetical protein